MMCVFHVISYSLLQIRNELAFCSKARARQALLLMSAFAQAIVYSSASASLRCAGTSACLNVK